MSGPEQPSTGDRINDEQRRLDAADAKIDARIDAGDDTERLTKTYVERVNDVQGRIVRLRERLSAQNDRSTPHWQRASDACDEIERALLSHLESIDPDGLAARAGKFNARVDAFLADLSAVASEQANGMPDGTGSLPEESDQHRVAVRGLADAYASYLSAESAARNASMPDDPEYRQGAASHPGALPYLEALLREVQDRDEWLPDRSGEREKERAILNDAARAAARAIDDLDAAMRRYEYAAETPEYERLRSLYVRRGARLAELLAGADADLSNAELRDARSAERRVERTMDRMTTDEAIAWAERLLPAMSEPHFQSDGQKQTNERTASAIMLGLQRKLGEEEAALLDEPSKRGEYARRALRVSKLVTGRAESVDANLRSIELGSLAAREAMGYDDLAFRFLETTLKRPNAVRSYVQERRAAVLGDLAHRFPELAQDPHVREMAGKLHEPFRSVEQLADQYVTLRTLERQLAGGPVPDLAAELTEKLTTPLEQGMKEFETFLTRKVNIISVWKPALTLEELQRAVGDPPLSAEQIDAWKLLSDIEGHRGPGDRERQMNALYAKLAGKIAVGVAIGMATGGLGVVGAAIAGGADLLAGAALDTWKGEGDFLSNLADNAMFFGLGYAEFGGPMLRALRGLPPPELDRLARASAGINVRRAALAKWCDESKLDAAQLLASDDLDALLASVTDAVAKENIRRTVLELRELKAMFADALQRAEGDASAAEGEREASGARSGAEAAKMERAKVVAPHLEYLRAHPDVPDDVRLAIAEELVGPLRAEQRDAILRAHNAGGSIGNVTHGQLRARREILEPFFDENQRALLIESGVCGNVDPLDAWKQLLNAMDGQDVFVKGRGTRGILRKVQSGYVIDTTDGRREPVTTDMEVRPVVAKPQGTASPAPSPKPPPPPPKPKNNPSPSPSPKPPPPPPQPKPKPSSSPSAQPSPTATNRLSPTVRPSDTVRGPRLDDSVRRRAHELANDDPGRPMDPFLERIAAQAMDGADVRVHTHADYQHAPKNPMALDRARGYSGYGNAVAITRDDVAKIDQKFTDAVGASHALHSLLNFRSRDAVDAAGESVRLGVVESDGMRTVYYRYGSMGYMDAGVKRGSGEPGRGGTVMAVGVRLDAAIAERVFRTLSEHPEDARAFFIAASQRVQHADYIWGERRPNYEQVEGRRSMLFVEQHGHDASQPALTVTYAAKQPDGTWHGEELPPELRGKADKASVSEEQTRRSILRTADAPERQRPKPKNIQRPKTMLQRLRDFLDI